VSAYPTAAGPPVLVDSHPDPVAEAEAMAETHLARQEEVRRVGSVVRWMDDLVRVPGTPKARKSDYAVVAAAVGLVGLGLAAPIMLLVWLVGLIAG
jgi:hypothetical protein